MVAADTAPCTREEFFATFQVAHGAASMAAVMATRKKGWRALAIQREEMEEAQKAADSIYTLAVKFPAVLGFIIQRPAELFTCVGTIVGYGMMKASVVKAALAQERPAPGAAPGAPPPGEMSEAEKSRRMSEDA